MKKISVEFSKHLPSEKRESFDKSIRSNTTLGSRLLELVKEYEAGLEKIELSSTQFSDPNWSHKQAFINGQKSTLRKLRDLLAIYE